MKATVRLGFGSGNPAGCPDFKPENPWGRPMPRYDQQYLPPPPLHQVFAHDKRVGKIIPVSPKMAKEYCDAICIAIGGKIASGDWKHWSNPHVVKLM
jgi:hypothetical protein